MDPLSTDQSCQTSIMTRFVFVVVLVALALSTNAKKQPFIDLTYALNNETVTWPGRVPVFKSEGEGETEDGV